MVVTVYYCSVTTTTALEKQQKRIVQTLEAFHIPHQLLDLSTNENLKDEMRMKVGDPKAMAPQIFNGDQYCGDFAAFSQAMEHEKVNQFFKVDNVQCQH
uniref:SH3 domain-binding glutamic acid-rich-like protein 3 n=1 Tax=Pristiophorus japonicus TaxID=55135 RepID=UPI00398E73D7